MTLERDRERASVGAVAAWVMLTAAALTAALSARPPGPAVPQEPARQPPPGVAVVLNMTGSIGGVLVASEFDQALRAAVAVLKEQPRSVERFIVLDLFSNGGQLAEVPALVDLTARAEAFGVRVVVRVRRAYSAAALVAISSDEIVFDEAAVMGAALTVDADPRSGRSSDLSPEQQNVALQVGRICADHGGHPRQLVLAMQLPTGLSGTPNSGGWTLANDESERRLLANSGTFLILNAESASALGVSSGTVSATNDPTGFDASSLANALGVSELGFVGADVSESYERRRLARVERTNSLMRELEGVRRSLALSRARSQLGTGAPPLDPDTELKLIHAAISLSDMLRVVSDDPELADFFAVDEAWIRACLAEFAAQTPEINLAEP